LLLKQVGHDMDGLFGISQGVNFVFPLNNQLISKIHSFAIFLFNLILFLVPLNLVLFDRNIVLELHVCEFLGLKILDDVVSKT
jgi:hypothetical protein